MTPEDISQALAAPKADEETRTVNTLITALRLYQRTPSLPADVAALQNGGVLTLEEIDELCENLSTGDYTICC